MTNEKAIERIKAFSIFLTGGNPIWDVDECREAFDIALAAMSERNPDEWCDSCKEYDHNKHCCPRFNRVIRETVEEVKQNAEQKWIPIKTRPMDDEERAEWSQKLGYDIEYEDAVIYTSQLPEDGQEALTCSRYGTVRIDGFENDPDYGCSFEENGDMDGIVAWMPIPMPWRGEEDERTD